MCESAAKSLVSALRSLQSSHFENIKLSDELITAISKLNLSDQTFLIKRAHYFLKIGLDQNALERQLQELQQQAEECELEVARVGMN